MPSNNEVQSIPLQASPWRARLVLFAALVAFVMLALAGSFSTANANAADPCASGQCAVKASLAGEDGACGFSHSE